MPQNNNLVRGTSIELPISLNPVTYDNFLDIGFTRNFASSQAYADKFQNAENIIPENAEKGLDYVKARNDVYDWLGFEAYDLLFDFLKNAAADPEIELDVFAYDLNEPDIVSLLEQLGTRLRIIIDNSCEEKNGKKHGHGAASSAESKAAKRLRMTAGNNNVKRLCFNGLQHHKVFIAKKNGQYFKVLAGSTNFSFRGIYIQANNILVFNNEETAKLFGKVFDISFHNPDSFKKNEVSSKWHLIEAEGKPRIYFCFSPHKSADLSLNPVRGAIDQANSSVLYAVAFLNQIKSGPTKEALDRLINRPVFSYGIVDKKGNLEVKKPNGSTGLVDFAYLSANAPRPFKEEWRAGKGINIHHKFVVTDFNQPNAKVFTGSSNLSPSGEKKNGDHLIMIEDMKIAMGYAIEALRIFDHLHFRSKMSDASKARKRADTKKEKDILTLKKPKAISGKAAWFETYYTNAQDKIDRELFAGNYKGLNNF
jgi:phosphatidylserine/phosphatidylglycerophosphate/cardiolipin synthase-like enzyme